MDTSGSITQFFYNIIPGSIFIFALSKIIDYSLYPLYPKEELFSFFIFISFGLLFGFIFQGLTKIDRKRPLKKYFFFNKKKYYIENLNNAVWDEIINADKPSYKLARGILMKMKVFAKAEKRSKFFYLMHNYLLAIDHDKQTDFYMARVAFWANVYFGTLVLLFLIFWVHKFNISPWAIVLVLFSRYFYHEYLRNLYDVVLKTFIMIKNPLKK